MSPVLSFDNVIAWLVQVSVLVFVGVTLPTLLRIRHPKSLLVYYHGLLALCFVLPFIQPFQHPLLLVSNVLSASVHLAPSSGLSWASIVIAIIAIGIAVKLCWLCAGLWQLRQYRRSAIPLFPVPVSIHEARKLTGADAIFCMSKDVTGPATLGYADPVVLLPVSFLSLDEDAQRSVACHELLHVRRVDWLITIVEEIAGALLWFHPAVWWLLARTKLTREQVVDAEVVRVTSTAPYIEALLAMAVVSKGRFALPAAPFFTEGHLVHRMRLLLANPRRSFRRLCVSYLSAVCLLGVVGWAALLMFPLTGEAHVVVQTHPQGQRETVVQVVASDARDHLKTAAQRTQLFNVRVPDPAGEPPDDVLYLANTLRFPPPPPPALLPGAVFRTQRFSVGPGQIVSPEDLQRFTDSLPKDSFVEVMQNADGVIQRVMITRRPSDETTSIPAGRGFFFHIAGPNTAGAAVSTESADGIH
jgi:beta-lactamase regulating signal transducer with metallopeptidase domain